MSENSARDKILENRNTSRTLSGIQSEFNAAISSTDRNMRYWKVLKTPFLKSVAGLITILFITACTAHYTVNGKITTVKSVDRYSLWRRAVSEKFDELFLILTFFGGGTRAAALSYGILKTMADTRIVVDGKQRRLLGLQTSFDIKESDIERLTAAARELLADSAQFQRLASDLQ